MAAAQPSSPRNGLDDAEAVPASSPGLPSTVPASEHGSAGRWAQLGAAWSSQSAWSGDMLDENEPEDLAIDIAAYAPVRKPKGRPKRAVPAGPAAHAGDVPGRPAQPLHHSGELCVAQPRHEAAASGSGHGIAQRLQQQLGSLMAPMFDFYQRGMVSGFASLPVSAGPLARCALEAHGKDSEEVDVEYAKVSEAYVLNPVYHVASAVVRSQMLSIGASHLEEKIMRLASAQLSFSKLARYHLEEGLSGCGGELVACFEGQAYDETPLRAGLKGECVVKFADSVGADKQQVPKPFNVQMVGGVLAVRQQSAICKVLQTAQYFGFLININSTFITIVGEQSVPLQILQRNSAEIFQEALSRNSSSTVRCQDYGMKVRLTSTDSASSILKAKKLSLR